MTGGVGLDQSMAFEKAAAKFPLELEFVVKAKPRDEFNANVNVDILDTQGTSILKAMSDGDRIRDQARQALRLDPDLAKAHFQLGTVLEDLQRLDEALAELREAARLDPSYAEPHMAMARVLHKLNQEAPAREEVQTYLRLHPHSTP